MPKTKRRPFSEAQKKHMRGTLGWRNPLEGFSQTLAKTALGSIVEAHRAFPQLEEGVRLLELQEKDAAMKALTLMADGKEQSEVDQAMAEYLSIGDRIAISERRLHSHEALVQGVEHDILSFPEVATAFNQLLSDVLLNSQEKGLKPEDQEVYRQVGKRFDIEVS